MLRETRERTLALMRARDEARHTAQIILLRKHLIAGADPKFDPYVF